MKMLRIAAFTLIVGFVFSLCACFADIDNATSSPAATPESTSFIKSYTIRYDFDADNFDVTFEDVYDYCCEIAGMDLDEFTLNDHGTDVHRIDQGDYVISYINYYQTYLNHNMYMDWETYGGWIDPEQYEYHITRGISFDYLFSFSEFDNEYWAEVNFSKILDRAYGYDALIDETHYPDGYCFADYRLNSLRRMFFAYYISGNCIMIYRHDFVDDGRDNTDYEVYLDLCDQFGLPTCPEITEEIMGSR